MQAFTVILFFVSCIISTQLSAQIVFQEDFNSRDFPVNWNLSSKIEKGIWLGKDNSGYIRFHPRYQQQFIETPSINFPAGNHLLFFDWNKAGDSNQDSVHVEITENNGSSWQTIYAIYSGNNRMWQTDSVAFNNTNGTIKFRWKYYSNGIFPAQYFNLDNVVIKTTIATSIKQNVSDITFGVFPNPNNGVFQIKLNNPKLRDGIIQITDSKGAIIFQQIIPAISQSLIQLNKSELSKGIYSIQLQTPSEVLSKNIIIQ
jgi:hypothetical protein